MTCLIYSPLPSGHLYFPSALLPPSFRHAGKVHKLSECFPRDLERKLGKLGFASAHLPPSFRPPCTALMFLHFCCWIKLGNVQKIVRTTSELAPVMR